MIDMLRNVLVKCLSTLATALLSLAALAFVGCSNDSTVPPAATSPPGDAVVDTSPSRESTFERILGHIPDNSESRQSLRVLDLARLRDGLGIDVPGEDAPVEDVLEFQIALFRQSFEVVGARIIFDANWLAGITDYIGTLSETPYDSIGFDTRNVDQVASFGGHEPRYREVLLGSYSPEVTDERLASCEECLPHEVVSHSGVGYYSWGGDFKSSLKLKFSKPAFDFLGRGGRILVMDGMAARTLSNEHMEQIIDASSGVQPSLADDPHYALAARTLTKYETTTAWFAGGGHSRASSIEIMEQLWDQGLRQEVTVEELKIQFSQAHLLLPFEVAAVGTAFPDSEGEIPQTYAVLVHSSEAEAEENADRLRLRIQQDERRFTFGVTKAEQGGDAEVITWAESFGNHEVWTEGAAMVLRIEAPLYGDRLQRKLLYWPDVPYLIDVLFLTE